MDITSQKIPKPPGYSSNGGGISLPDLVIPPPSLVGNLTTKARLIMDPEITPAPPRFLPNGCMTWTPIRIWQILLSGAAGNRHSGITPICLILILPTFTTMARRQIWCNGILMKRFPRTQVILVSRLLEGKPELSMAPIQIISQRHSHLQTLV